MNQPHSISINDLPAEVQASLREVIFYAERADTERAAFFAIGGLQRSPAHVGVFVNLAQQVLAQLPDDPHMLMVLAEADFLRGANDTALEYLRRIEAGPGAQVLKVKAALMRRERELAGAAPAAGVLVACAPKSGSTFVANALAAAMGAPNAKLIHEYYENAQDLYPPAVVDSMGRSWVAQHHTLPTGPNLELIQRAGIRVIVLTRNIFDTAVSIVDHIDQQGRFSPIVVRLGREWQTLSQQAKLDRVIDTMLPWYFAFVQAWQSVVQAKLLPMLHWDSYEAVMADKPAGLVRMLAGVGVGISAEQAAQGVEKVSAEDRTRRNKGVSGRGEQALTDAQKERIRALAGHYPGSDFGKLGL